MTGPVELLDIVRVIEDVPAEGVRCGQVGAVVEELASDAFLVEFVNDDAETEALATLHSHQLNLEQSHRQRKAGDTPGPATG